MAKFFLLLKVLLAFVCIAFAGNLLVDATVFVPTLERLGSGFVRGVGAYVMAAGWLCAGLAAVVSAFSHVVPSSYAMFTKSRNVFLFFFGICYLFAIFGFLVQEGG